MENDKITVVCPYCSKDMAVDAKEKNHKVTCIACSQSFIAYEALRCQKCGTWKHPNHNCKECGCNFDKNYSAGLWNYIENKEQREQEKNPGRFCEAAGGCSNCAELLREQNHQSGK